RGVLLLVGLLEEFFLRVLALGRGAVQDVVPLAFHLPGVLQQRGYRGQEHRGDLTASAYPHKTADRLCEEQRRTGGGRVHTHHETGYVHPLGDHAYRDHPSVVALGESGNLLGGRRVVGEHHRRTHAGYVSEESRIGTSVLVITGDDQTTGVRVGLADLGQPAIGRVQDLLDPVTLGVEGCPPGLGERVLCERLTQPGGEFVTGAGAPAHLAGVGHEDDRTDHPVLQRGGITVVVVPRTAAHTRPVLHVIHERDRVDVGAERCPGQ